SLAPVVQDFKNFIEGDGAVYTAFREMFRQAAASTAAGAAIEDYEELMEVIDATLMVAPTYRPGPSAMVAGVPFYGIIARFCNTPAGYEAFTHPGVNARFCAVFTEWHAFLLSPESAEVIVPEPEAGGWLSPEALDAMVQSAGGDPKLEKFQDFYVCDPSAEHYGFTSYDEFFVRELLPHRWDPELPNNPEIVNSPCSSTVHKLYRNLAHTDRFYIKNTPYSLSHMLAGDARVDDFVGGTLLQAMLGSLDYHGWRSPVRGTVVGTRLISGMEHLDGVPPAPHPTYYAACLDNNRTDLDVVSRSQDFVSAISTRALIFIQAEEPVGLVCFVGVGLGEVSTCKIVVKEGDLLEKGSKLGDFHFGGSTYCLIFRPGLNV
ncbi:hypothetical protein M404DRAFT_85235, partial [Pisolithus tinctorius Marx 270]